MCMNQDQYEGIFSDQSANKTDQNKLDKHTWICPDCGTVNTTSSCNVCGYAKPFNIGFLFNSRRLLLRYITIISTIVFLIIGYFSVHFWSEASCTEDSICKLCGKVRVFASGHLWEAATCTLPEICQVCGETRGSASGHTWQDANCIMPKACVICNETVGEVAAHQWLDADCVTPRMCQLCSETDGFALGHSWKEATYLSPKTCAVCGITEGTPLIPNPIYLNELGVMPGHVGKVWTRSSTNPNGTFHTNSDVSSDCWNEWDIPGHTVGTVLDNYGNRYSYAIFIDGKDTQVYYMEFQLDGKYTKFSGTCASPDKENAVSSFVYNARTKYSKAFEVYCDGTYVGSSPTMRFDYAPQYFEFDVTGVDVLKILYTSTMGPNEVASIYDGLLS